MKISCLILESSIFLLPFMKNWSEILEYELCLMIYLYRLTLKSPRDLMLMKNQVMFEKPTLVKVYLSFFVKMNVSCLKYSGLFGYVHVWSMFETTSLDNTCNAYAEVKTHYISIFYLQFLPLIFSFSFLVLNGFHLPGIAAITNKNVPLKRCL